MKYLSEKRALERLADIKDGLREAVSEYERRAKDCGSCSTPGACCQDAHFVNVHISRLEAVAIRRVLDGLTEGLRAKVERRIDEAIERYGLSSDGDSFAQGYACPLFEKGLGCLVHHQGKPAACITHACYERREHLPPDELGQAAERAVEELNSRTYGRQHKWLPIPRAIVG